MKVGLFTILLSVASFVGAGSRANAATFGNRECCESTPVACPPSAPSQHSSVTPYVVNQPNYSLSPVRFDVMDMCRPRIIAAPCNPCGGIQYFNQTNSVAYTQGVPVQSGSSLEQRVTTLEDAVFGN
jgi:hypothetical protein